MNNFAISLVKLTAMATGAALGVLLARWYEEIRSTRAHEQSQHDKTRYAQGLSPLKQQRVYPIEWQQDYQTGEEA